jgi:predicted dehydrogenase
MILKEKALPDNERMDFICIVTPNNLHFGPAKLALENGFHIMSDKPMTHNLKEAMELVSLVEKTGLVFGLTHNYTGYPMVKQARAMVSNGELGKIRKIAVEYFQGWLATKLEDTDHKQAGWRTDPKQSGAANCMGDIGTHAENLAEYITGLKIESLCADLTSFVDGRTLEDDGNVLLRFDNGARGTLLATQIAIGEENGLKIRIYGEKGGLEWSQQEPNSLKINWLDKPFEVMRTGTNFSGFANTAIEASRIPAGHPEGFIDAFANIYKNFAVTLQAKMDGKEPDPVYLDFPTVYDGARGMAFIETVVESSKSPDKWVKFKSYS